MEQAQIGKELAAGNGFSTKVIRPITLWQLKKNGKDIPDFDKFPDTYHAPLPPLLYGAIFKAIDGNNVEKWQMKKGSNIYALDRIVAATCVLFFVIAIGVNYLLVSRIFDTTIASITALLMVFCSLMWRLAQSGLPQMLMLMLFSFAMLHLWKAVEKQEENKSTLSSIFLAALFMSLLALTHWITIWAYIGFTIFTAIYFKPKGAIAVTLIGMLALITLPVMYFLYMLPSGSPFGTAFFAIHDGLGFSEDYILRSLSPENQELGLKGLLLKILGSTLAQVSDLHKNLGSILVAPLFFIALLHTFKRHSLRAFSWLIALMWIFASIGMTIYGTKDGVMDANQINILFAPLMTAYGLAIVSVLWARIDIPQSMYSLRYMHFIIIIFVSTGPMLLSLPKDIKTSLAVGKAGMPQLPNYYPPSLNRELAANTSVNDTIISDAPWAVAWYANRTAIWLPQDLKQIEDLEKIAQSKQKPVSGVIITPYSFNYDKIIGNAGQGGMYTDLFPLVYGAWARQGGVSNFLISHPKFKSSFTKRYPRANPLFYGGYMTYYSKKPLVPFQN